MRQAIFEIRLCANSIYNSNELLKLKEPLSWKYLTSPAFQWFAFTRLSVTDEGLAVKKARKTSSRHLEELPDSKAKSKFSFSQCDTR